MAIYFDTTDSQKLLSEFKKKIDEKKVVTWAYDKDGDFTHTAEQWKNRAWLRPKHQEGKLALFIIGPTQQPISTLIYAIYHGRFIETMLSHCDSLFSKGKATAMPEGVDNVSPSA